jgi:hypothetical protein
VETVSEMFSRCAQIWKGGCHDQTFFDLRSFFDKLLLLHQTLIGIRDKELSMHPCNVSSLLFDRELISLFIDKKVNPKINC